MENLEENQKNLLQITDRFFLAIINSSSEFPPQLRSVCHCLYQVLTADQSPATPPLPQRLTSNPFLFILIGKCHPLIAHV